MKKTKKALAALAIIGMVATMAPMNAFAATGVTTDRLYGADRVGTAVNVAEKFVSATTAILAPSADANLVDALAAAPLARKTSPILLTENNTLNAATKAELIKLGVKNVYVVGAIDAAVVAQVNAISGVTATPLKGADRIATAALISAKLTSPAGSFVVGYNALADALSVASFAAANNYSILVANLDGSLPASEVAYKGATVYTVGGPTLVANITGATRLAGADRFATNKVVLDTLGYTNLSKVYVANGTDAHLVDSLVASSLAASAGAPIVLTDTATGGDATAVDIYAKLATNAVVVALGGSTVVTDSTVAKVVTGVVAIPTGTLSVVSVSAISANSFKVVFNQAPADTSKVTFAVERSTTPVTTTTTWNAAKTEATVSSAANLPEGSYTVAVKNDTTDLGTSTIAVTSQKVAKINITSSKLSVANVTTGSTSTQTGYATYEVLDQYGNDITSTYLANSLTFQSGVGSITAKDGVLKLTPSDNMNLIQFSTVVITAYDSTTGVSTSATLTTSTALGTLSNMILNKLTNADDKVLTAGDTSNTWYIDYSATDISGNATKNYDLVKSGLIINDDDQLTTSSSYVKAKIVEDPSDSSKAAIEVTVTGDTVSMDIPVSITAMTYAGTNSTLNLTLKKASTVDTFTVMAPAYDIAVNETKEIPFVAYDQNGIQLTKFSDLKDTVTFSPSGTVNLMENVDGTARLMVGPFTGTGPQIITAVPVSPTSGGKFSSVTLNIQKPVLADTLSLDSTVFVTAMQAGGSEQSIDFGYNYGGLAVKDQYGRTIDMQKYNSEYEVLATVSSGTGNIAVIPTTSGKVETTGPALVFGGNGVKIKSLAAGTGTVTFKLVAKADLTKEIDTKSVTFSVLANKDIKDYVMDTVANPIYANPTTVAGVAHTERDAAYVANPSVYGKTSSGSKVVLAGSPIIGVNVDNTTDFMVDTVDSPIGGYDSVEVFAGKLASNVTEATTNLIVTLMGADNKPHTLTTPIKSSTVTPVAKTITFAVGNFLTGISVNNDTVTIPASFLTAGKSMTRYNAAGNNDFRAPAYFVAVDSYGTKAMKLSQVLKVPEGSTGNFAVDSNGTITTGAVAGEEIVISGITTNGMMKTVKLVVTAGGVTPPSGTAVATVTTVEASPFPGYQNVTVTVSGVADSTLYKVTVDGNVLTQKADKTFFSTFKSTKTKAELQAVTVVTLK